jgi:hypothetical protein
MIFSLLVLEYGITQFGGSNAIYGNPKLIKKKIKGAQKKEA